MLSPSGSSRVEVRLCPALSYSILLKEVLIVEEDTLNLGECVDDIIYPAPPTREHRNGLLLGVEINRLIWVSWEHRGSWPYQNHHVNKTQNLLNTAH